MCRASVQGWYPTALDWCASSLWGKPWTSASHPLPSRSGQSQGPGQARSSQLRTIGTLTWKVACVCLCVHVCVHTLETRVGGDSDRIDLNRVCVCVCVCACVRVHTLETRVGGDVDRIDLNRVCVCVCVCVYVCVHTLETRVGGDGNRIDLNRVCVSVCVHMHVCTHCKNGWRRQRLHRPESCVCVCVCVCVCMHACVHTLETRVAGDGNCIDLNRVWVCVGVCVCVCTHVCTHWKQWLEEMATA